MPLRRNTSNKHRVENAKKASRSGKAANKAKKAEEARLKILAASLATKATDNCRLVLSSIIKNRSLSDLKPEELVLDETSLTKVISKICDASTTSLLHHREANGRRRESMKVESGKW